MINVVSAKIQALVTNGQQKQENQIKKEKIERIKLNHGFDFVDIINIITVEPRILYGIYFSNQDMEGVLN